MWFTEKGDEACTEFGDKKGNSQSSVMNSSQAGIAHIYVWAIWFWIHWKRQRWLGKWNVKSFSMTRNMEQCEVRPTDLKVVIDSVSLDYWSITVQKVSQRCKRYILNVKPIVSLIDKRTKLWRCKSCIHFGSNFGFNIFAWHLWLILLMAIFWQVSSYLISIKKNLHTKRA